MKTCARCNQIKNLGDFGPDKRKKDGREGACRICERIRKRKLAARPDQILKKQKRRKKYPEREAAYNKAYRLAHPEQERIRQNQYRHKNPEKRRTWEATYKVGNLEKLRAKNKIKQEVKMGRLIKLPCRICGIIKVEAHHPDYSKPLEVVWLCKQHHEDAHHKTLQLT